MTSWVTPSGAVEQQRPVVRLIRHGETADYHRDAGLTARGRDQAMAKGHQLLATLGSDSLVALVHSPRERAYQTAALIAAVIAPPARADLRVLGHLVEDPAFDNFRVALDDHRELEVTAAFPEFDDQMKQHHDAGRPPAWVEEADRFWSLHAAGGDPIGHWITHPALYLESSASVVQRALNGIRRLLDRHDGVTEVIVASHSGPLRALTAYAFGDDPGEPVHLAELTISSGPDLSLQFTYDGASVCWPDERTAAPTWLPRRGSRAQFDHV